MKGYWIKDNKRWGGSPVLHNGCRIFNPTPEILSAAGFEYHEVPEYVPTITDLRQNKIAEIKGYDMSAAINTFTIDGESVWWSKAVRVGLVNSLNFERSFLGKTESEVWINNRPFILPIERWLQILGQIEMYALEVYKTTARHRANVAAMESQEQIDAYDYTIGYPEKLNISTAEL